MASNNAMKALRQDDMTADAPQLDDDGSTAVDAAVILSPSDTVLIHARFWPNGRVWEIAECPPNLSKDEWFQLLATHIGDKYQTRAGGRGFFKTCRRELDAVKLAKPN